jgi:hypothetical protein
MGPRAGIDAAENKKKYLALAGNRTPAVQPVDIKTELSRYKLIYEYI